jgi:hypothetical protein
MTLILLIFTDFFIKISKISVISGSNNNQCQIQQLKQNG